MNDYIENPLSDQAHTALLIGAVLTTALGVMLIYQASKPSVPPVAQEQFPQFSPNGPQVYYTTGPYETAPQEIVQV